MLELGPAHPEELTAACRGLFADEPDADRDRRTEQTLSLFTSGELDPAGLWVARDRSTIVASGYLDRLPGRLALVWPPTVDPPEQADPLLRAMLTSLPAHEVVLVQALVRPEQTLRSQILTRAGFQYISELQSLIRPLERKPTPIEPGPLTAEPVPTPTDELVATLLATYEQTHDFPELNEGRTEADLVAGYLDRAGPQDWMVVREGSQAIGVLVLIPTPNPDTIELSYLGLLPCARHKGYGRTVVEFARNRAIVTGASWLVTSVDVRNLPACRLYRGRQFQSYDLQQVYLFRVRQSH